MLSPQQITIGETVRGLLSGTPVNKLNINLKQNRLTSSNTHIKVWSDVAEEMTKSLDDIGVKYVLIKAFDVPHAHMDDVDLLIEEEDGIQETLTLLRKKGYSLFRDRYSLNPLKITAINPHRKKLQVDIYPEPTWFNMRYASNSFITNRRVRRIVWGVEAYMPNPTLDFYINATHSYNHGFISLAEAAYCVHLISENQLDWNSLRTLATKFKLNHALYPFLKVAQLSLSNKIDNEMDKLIDYIVRDDALTKIFSNWFTRASFNGFPLKLPLNLRILSSFIRIFRPSLKSYTKGYDELVGYALAFFLRGKKRRAIN